ncbi:DnaD domain protein [Bacillus sp. MRMR6]|uniref:DnaD domain protein n=1 Tax=Bacillus sp. MRMR6 TaxID=1928617 RepID=UPI00158DCA5E|nr:DnaD domain protein [Bacillus sp. MRMR6]
MKYLRESGMNQLETNKTLSEKERKQILSLLDKYSIEEIEMAVRRINTSKNNN